MIYDSTDLKSIKIPIYPTNMYTINSNGIFVTYSLLHNTSIRIIDSYFIYLQHLEKSWFLNELIIFIVNKIIVINIIKSNKTFIINLINLSIFLYIKLQY